MQPGLIQNLQWKMLLEWPDINYNSHSTKAGVVYYQVAGTLTEKEQTPPHWVILY